MFKVVENFGVWAEVAEGEVLAWLWCLGALLLRRLFPFLANVDGSLARTFGHARSSKTEF